MNGGTEFVILDSDSLYVVKWSKWFVYDLKNRVVKFSMYCVATRWKIKHFLKRKTIIHNVCIGFWGEEKWEWGGGGGEEGKERLRIRARWIYFWVIQEYLNLALIQFSATFGIVCL